MINFICAESSNVGNIILWVVLIVALLFMLIFPTFTQRKRNKQYEQMLQGIRVGDTVRTAGGIIGRVIRITKKGEITTVTLETGTKNEKSYTEFDMNFINCVLKSTRVEESAGGLANADVEIETEDEDAETAENEDAAADVSLKTAEAPVEAEAKESEEPASNARTKSAVKKTPRKSAKK